jgi:AraC family transcriptional regulator
LLRALALEAAQSDRSSRLFLEQALDLLVMHLVRAHSSAAVGGADRPGGSLPAWKLRRIEAYATERLGDSIGLGELATAAGLSRSHFCTAFRHTTGCTPYEWLTRKRLERARVLLREGMHSITEIALMVGYGTPSAFAAAFRREVGVSPSTFRRDAF